MSNLVYQHMSHDSAQRFVVLGPVVEDWAAIQPDHVWHLHWRALRAERQANTLKQAQQIKRALYVHVVEHLVRSKILDLDHESLAQSPEPGRQAHENLACQSLQVRQ